mgnify:CR=1 FL=1|jgi:myosin heavy subunit
MAESKELKPKSFRINDETAEKFKEISMNIGGNQQETLSKLIEAYEFQAGKAVLTEKKADIEQFEKYITAITRMFMGSLEDNQNVSETIRTEFDALLKSKDSVIADLQKKVVDAKESKDTAEANAKVAVAENQKLNDRVDQMEKMLIDKEQLNKALTDSCNELKSKVESMTAASKENEALKKDIADLTSSKDKLMSDIKKHEEMLKEQQEHEKIALEQLQQKCDLNKEKEMLQLEKQYSDEIQKLKAEKQAEVDSYQKKYMELLEKLQDK